MKKIIALPFFLTLPIIATIANSYTDSMTIINNVAGKGTISLSPDNQKCVAGFSTSYAWGQPIESGQSVVVNTTTADLSSCDGSSFSMASWQFNIYYTPPGKKNAFYLGAIGTSEMGSGPFYYIMNIGDSWFTINNPQSPSTTTTLVGTPPEISHFH